MDQSQVMAALCPPLDKDLVAGLISEFLAAERRYLLGDWEPATLDGGQFAEIASRIVYHVDSENLSLRKGVNDCLTYVEDPKGQLQHHFPQRRASLHLAKVLRTMYKFRSQRGAVHIDPEYTANELDSTLVVAQMRWVVSEIFRIFWTADRKLVARVVREIVRFEVPAVLSVNGRPFVIRTDCTIEEEVLLALHSAGEEGLTSTELVDSTPRPDASIRSAISRLKGSAKREIILREDGRYLLSPNGSRRLHGEIGRKLAVE